jgi:hypothetical protein
MVRGEEAGDELLESGGEDPRLKEALLFVLLVYAGCVTNFGCD